jgi:hypothetical protein
MIEAVEQTVLVCDRDQRADDGFGRGMYRVWNVGRIGRALNGGCAAMKQACDEQRTADDWGKMRLFRSSPDATNPRRLPEYPGFILARTLHGF